MNMPRGAFPTPRSELAASEPFRTGSEGAVFVPSGSFPTPNHELASAKPYRSDQPNPESFIAWPSGFTSGVEIENKSLWTEEAFAKACSDPKTLIYPETILAASQQCGSSNFAEFMQTVGLQQDGLAYLDGPFLSVNWTNEQYLQSAIAQIGPVKIGVSSANLAAGRRGNVSPGKNGWAICDLPAGQPGDCCASLFGYGPLATLVELFEKQGVSVDLPADMLTGLCYAMFVLGSVAIIDRLSLMNITSEAWVREPTTVVKILESFRGDK